MSKYCFREQWYSAKQLDEIIYKAGEEKGKQIKIIISQRTLSNILEKGNMPKLSKKVEELARRKEKCLGSFYSSKTEKEQIKARKKYSRYGKKFGHLSEVDSLDRLTFYTQLLYKTLSNHIPYALGANDACSEYSFVDVEKLTAEQCVAIANNFKRAMKNQELVPLQHEGDNGHLKKR